MPGLLLRWQSPPCLWATPTTRLAGAWQCSHSPTRVALLSGDGVTTVQKASSSQDCVRHSIWARTSFSRRDSRRSFQFRHPPTPEFGEWCSIVPATDGDVDSVTGWDRVRVALFKQLFPTDFRVFHPNGSKVTGFTNDPAAYDRRTEMTEAVWLTATSRRRTARTSPRTPKRRRPTRSQTVACA